MSARSTGKRSLLDFGAVFSKMLEVILRTAIVTAMISKPGESCNKCRTHSYKPHSPRADILSSLPEHTRLHDLALMGTHASASWESQDLSIQEQLHHGVRVLDVGIRPRFDLFEVFVPDSDLGFHEILMETLDFLAKHPGELIILLVHEDEPNPGSSKTNCDILDFYVSHLIKRKEFFVANWSLDDFLSQHRGKVLLASEDFSFLEGKCVFNARQCRHGLEVSRHYVKYDVEDKWDDISAAISISFLEENGCHINDISFDDRQNGRRAVARDAGFYKGDICAKAINFLMAEVFRKPPGVMVIVLADFITQELIDKIIYSNYRDLWP